MLEQLQGLISSAELVSVRESRNSGVDYSDPNPDRQKYENMCTKHAKKTTTNNKAVKKNPNRCSLEILALDERGNYELHLFIPEANMLGKKS